MQPLVIALVGRPNVGKSTLFNVLTGTRDALVIDMPGVTRDRQYGEAQFDGQKFILIDTGGLTEERAGIEDPMYSQAWQAVEEADILFFLVDARVGFLPEDRTIAERLRKSNKPCYLIANKTDGLDPDVALAELYEAGLGAPLPIAASQRRGVRQLMSHVIDEYNVPDDGRTQRSAPTEPQSLDTSLRESDSDRGNLSGGLDSRLHGNDTAQETQNIKIALVGRPNVGKSTLTNRLLGEDRVIVYDMPGTTRDSIYIPFERHGKHYTVIDTAGVRKKGRVHETVEKFSIVKTLKAIDDANIVVILLDAQEALTEQDLHLIGFSQEAGRGLVIAFNKWDGLTQDERDSIKEQMERRLGFIASYVDIHFISALHGTGVGHLFKSIHQAYDSAMQSLSTPKLTRILEDAIATHQPPTVSGRRVKLKYAHAGGHNPPLIVIHGNMVEKLPGSYQQYLVNQFRTALKLRGTPIRIVLKDSDNPYEGKAQKKRELTTRQVAKKRRARKLFGK